MMRLTRFRYLSPTSPEESVALLQHHGPDAVLMAGGTDLLVNVKHRLVTPRYVIGIRHLSALQMVIPGADGWLTLGAGISLKRVAQEVAILNTYPALSQAAHSISTPQVRAIGTIGGNVCLDTRCNYYNQSYDWRRAIGFCMKKDSPICRVAPGGDRCWAVASADTVPVLLALRAEVTILGPQGTRRSPLESLYVDDGISPLTLHPNEVVTSIHLPPTNGYVCVYKKFRIRQSFDFPLVGVATAVKQQSDGTVSDARIVLTAVASLPQRASAAERALRDRRLDDNSIEEAGQSVFRLAKPMDNTAGSIFHRKRMARVLVERSLREIAGNQ